jgi:hypothetical protein
LTRADEPTEASDRGGERFLADVEAQIDHLSATSKKIARNAENTMAVVQKGLKFPWTLAISAPLRMFRGCEATATTVPGDARRAAALWRWPLRPPAHLAPMRGRGYPCTGGQIGQKR